MGSCAQGAQAALYVEPGASPHTFDTSSERYEFLYESLQKRGRIVGGTGIRGTRSPHSARTRAGHYTVGGRVAMNVDPAGLDAWLPRILGAAESSDSFALAESLPSFGVLVDRVTETFEYTDCVVNQAMFHGKAGPEDGEPELIEMVLDLIGKTEVANTSAPSVSLSTAANATPYVFSDSALTLQSGSREVKEWWLLISNHIQPRWVNSLSATQLCPRDRTVILRTRLPYDTDTDDLYGQALAGATGSLALTNGNLGTTFTFGTLQVPDESPIVRGKTEIDLFLTLTARMTGTTRELVVTNDSVA